MLTFSPILEKIIHKNYDDIIPEEVVLNIGYSHGYTAAIRAEDRF